MDREKRQLNLQRQGQSKDAKGHALKDAIYRTFFVESAGLPFSQELIGYSAWCAFSGPFRRVRAESEEISGYFMLQGLDGSRHFKRISVLHDLSHLIIYYTMLFAEQEEKLGLSSL